MYILQGLADGFHTGFDRQSTKLRQAKGNMSSTKLNPSALDLYTVCGDRKAEGSLIGPISEDLNKHCQLSPTGLIPKSTRCWHLIVDLSSPSNGSVNDGIDPAWCSMHCEHYPDTGHKGTQLSKLDLKNAYRMVPVHPDDQPLLGIWWCGAVYLDAALPLGTKNIFSGSRCRVIQTKGIRHHLDNFLFLSPPGSPQASSVQVSWGASRTQQNRRTEYHTNLLELHHRHCDRRTAFTRGKVRLQPTITILGSKALMHKA